MTEYVPAKANFDFKGWATDAEGTNILVTYDVTTKTYGSTDALDNYEYADNNKTLILYAIFETHKHRVDFVYPDGSIETEYITWNTPAVTPTKAPYKPDVDENGIELDLEETWQFLGWNTNPNAEAPDERFSNNSFIITKDYLAANNNGIYTVWGAEPISVYENIHPEFFEKTILANGDLKIKLIKAV